MCMGSLRSNVPASRVFTQVQSHKQSAVACDFRIHSYRLLAITAWVFEVLLVPMTMCIVVGSYWVYRDSTQGRQVANTKAMDEGFFVLFLW